jgi:hypothetical protein
MASDRGNPNPELGNSNRRSCNPNQSEKVNRLEEEPTWMDVSMVLMIPTEFHALMKNVT